MVESSSTTIFWFFQRWFLSLTNLERNDFDSRFDIQEVTTGSAFVSFLLKIKTWKIELDKNKTEKWLDDHCKTGHKALLFFAKMQS
jgi:trans-2,3-dihydro-3-hydroxyanthranilate isomerase